MERPIQVGDFALIADELFKITAVSPSHIDVISLINPNRTNVIVPVANGWKSEVKFLPADSHLTYVPDIDKIILSHLDRSTLDLLCSSDGYVATLCKDETIWRLFIENKYPDLLQGKEVDETWQDFYRIIPKLFNGNGKLDLIKLLEHGRLNLLKTKEMSSVEKYYLKHYGANKAAEYGQNEVIIWLLSNGGLPNQEGADLAAGNGHLETVKLLYRELQLRPRQRGLNKALENGYFNVVKWIYSIDPSLHFDPNLAVGIGRLDIIDWMENDIKLPYRVNVRGANLAAENGLSGVLDILAKREIFPNQIGINLAARNNHLNVLEQIRPPVPFPDQEGANEAAGNGYEEVLEWLKHKAGVLPDYRGIDKAIENEHFEIIDWGARQIPPIFPSQRGVNWAAQHGRKDILERIKESVGILPDVMGANLAAANGHIRELNWIEIETNFEIFPDEEGADFAAENGQIKSLKWLAHGGNREEVSLRYKERLILPTEEGADGAAINGQEEVLDWLKQRLIYPSEEVVDGVIKRNQPKTLIWLNNNGYYIDPATSTVEWAFKHGYLELLEILELLRGKIF